MRGVRIAGGETVPAEVVVSNADPGQTYGRLLGGRRRRWSPQRLGRQRWSMGLFVWYFGTRGTRDMWPDVGHHTILNGPRYRELVRDIFVRGRLAEDFSLYLHRPTVTDPSAAPAGDDTFYALSPVPHLGFADAVDWAEAAEPYRRRVAAALEAVLPGLRRAAIGEPGLHAGRLPRPLPRARTAAASRSSRASCRAPGSGRTIARRRWRGCTSSAQAPIPGAGLPGVIASAEVVGKLIPDAVPAAARGLVA